MGVAMLKYSYQCADFLFKRKSRSNNSKIVSINNWSGMVNLHVPKKCFFGEKFKVFLSRNYRLIAPRKFDVLKTNIGPRSFASRANMLV